MGNRLRTLCFILAGLSAPAGYLMDHHPAHSWWHAVPFLDALVGGAGALLLMITIKAIASFASRKEGFYD